MDFRTELLMEYHNSRGHPGRDQTFEAVAADWWWPRMYSDILEALKVCTVCASQHGANRMSAWTRTTLYAHHFTALQFDFMACEHVNGYCNILVVVCLFQQVGVADRHTGPIGFDGGRGLVDTRLLAV